MAACRMKDTYNKHQSVLLTEVIEQLAIQPDGIYVDATFGRGGHAKIILDHLGSHGHLFAMDKDPDAVAYARENFSHDNRFTISHGSFVELASFLKEENVYGKINAILFDLGVSSPQLDDPDRGFSFMREGQLDMRMDPSRGISAATFIAKTEEKELANVLWKYGEERYARRIAAAIIAARQERPITTTTQLAEIVAKAHPSWQKGRHPATRSFQAIRMAINQELEELEQGLEQSLHALKVGGRLLVISFHSLEDRVVKKFMQRQELSDPYPRDLPVKHRSVESRFKRLGRAIRPSENEIAGNPRARSATLRTGEKLS